MTVGFGSLWVKRDNNVVARIAPDGTILATIDPRVFAEPVCQGLGVSDHAVWGCAAPGKIARIDPRTNKVAAIIDIPKVNEQGRIPAYDGRIWVLTGDGDQLVGISERTNRASRTIPLGVFCTDVADQPVGATLWVACPYDGVVLRADLDGGTVVGKVGGLQQAAGVTASTESVWVCTNKGIAQVDVASMTVATLQRMAAGFACNLRLIDEALWVRTGWRTSPFLARIDTSSGQLVQTVSRPGRVSGGDFISFADAAVGVVVRARARLQAEPVQALTLSLSVPAARCEPVSYSGWKTAIVLPSGSLNQADRPMPGEVTTWSTVLKVGVS